MFEDLNFLGCNAVSQHEQFPTFRQEPNNPKHASWSAQHSVTSHTSLLG